MCCCSGEPSTPASPFDVSSAHAWARNQPTDDVKRRSFAVDVGHERHGAALQQETMDSGGYSAPASAFSPTIRKRSTALLQPPSQGEARVRQGGVCNVL